MLSPIFHFINLNSFLGNTMYRSSESLHFLAVTVHFMSIKIGGFIFIQCICKAQVIMHVYAYLLFA